jgi:hypothetical protein
MPIASVAASLADFALPLPSFSFAFPATVTVTTNTDKTDKGRVSSTGEYAKTDPFEIAKEKYKKKPCVCVYVCVCV